VPCRPAPCLTGVGVRGDTAARRLLAPAPRGHRPGMADSTSKVTGRQQVRSRVTKPTPRTRLPRRWCRMHEGSAPADADLPIIASTLAIGRIRKS
jgi:hypothetical protein